MAITLARHTRARARVVARIDRLANDNFGDCKPVGGGVHELRIDYGPGYRVYFALIARQVVLLLCGGDKSTQTRDIAAAIRYFQDFKNRTRHDENPT